MRYVYLSILLILSNANIYGKENTTGRQVFADFGLNNKFNSALILNPFLNFNVQVHKNLGVAIGYQRITYLSPTSPVQYPNNNSDKVKFSNVVRSFNFKAYLQFPTALPELRFALEAGPSILIFEDKEIYIQPPRHWMGEGTYRYNTYSSTHLGFMATAKFEIPVTRKFGFTFGVSQFLASKKSFTNFQVGLLIGRLR